MNDLKEFSDEELVTLYMKGDEKAFEEIYLRYSLKMKRLIYYYLGDSDAAEDVYHEVFIRVLRHIDNFRINMVFSSWIYQIAVNCSKNYLKSRKKNEELVDREKFRIRDSAVSERSPEEQLIDDVHISAFNRAVEGLHEKFRDVFLLRFDQKMKYSDIARILS